MVSGYTLGITGLVTLFAIGGCEKHAPETAPSVGSAVHPPAPTPPAPTPPTPPIPVPAPKPDIGPGTWYRAHLKFDGIGQLPFFLHVPPVGKNGKAYVINGSETADFETEWRDNEVTITGPWAYVSMIEADVQKGTNKLTGTWTRTTPLWGAVVRDFEAEPIDKVDPTTRFPAGHGKPMNVTGTWRFQFAEHGVGKGTMTQDPDGVVRGFIKPGQLGDIRFLAGNAAGGKLSLSTFNGNSANLVLGDVSADGMSMTGIMSMQNVWNEKFTAKKVPDFQFENLVHLKPGATTVALKGLDKYKGKPTIAVIFATWCSSCNDAYPFFKQLYAKYHSAGLEIYGVAYDLTDDEKANQAELDQFRVKHDLKWELLQVPCTPETWAKAMPPELVGWDGLPIIMLVKPDGTVASVFGGWLGPATGVDNERLQNWFEEATKALVEGKDITPR